MDNYSIVHPIEWKISEGYNESKRAIQLKLNEWGKLFTFFDHNQTIRFQTEGPLIPENNGKEPVLILLSNPHPHSIQQGMILSPNRAGHVNPFWETLGASGYFKRTGPINAKVMIRNEYESPFRLFMAVLIPFPSELPTDLKEIFGLFLYDKMIKDGANSIKKVILDNNIRHVICFGKLQFEAMAGATMSYRSM